MSNPQYSRWLGQPEACRLDCMYALRHLLTRDMFTRRIHRGNPRRLRNIRKLWRLAKRQVISGEIERHRKARAIVFRQLYAFHTSYKK